MNTLENATIRAPSDTDETCAKLTIDDILTPFVFHAIAKIGEPYTLSFYIKAETEGEVEAGGKTMAVTTEWTKFVASFVSSSVDVPIYFKTAGTYYMFNCQLEIGNKVSDWRPAAEDTDVTTAKMMAAIELSKSEILSTVSYTYALQTEVDDIQSWRQVATQQITKDGIISTVGSYYATSTELSAAESNIAQNAEAIELRVEKAGVISAINQSAETITIDASKINLTASGIIDIINSGTTKIAASKINLSATDIVNIIGGSTVKIAAKNIDLSGYVTVTDLSTKGRTTIVGDNITSGTITGIAFKGVTGDFAGKITASELVTKVLMHDAVYGEIYFTSGTIHLSTRDHSNPLDPDAISYLSLSSYLTGSSELFSMSSLVLAGYDGVYIEAENEGTVAEFNHTQVEITPRLTVLNGLYMGSPTQTGTEHKIAFQVSSGTYQHYSYIYGGNSNSQSAIGIWDNKNGRHVWKYYDTYGTFEVNVPLILKNGFEIYGTYPNIDFHYNNNGSSDYTSRIIEMSSGILQVNGVKFSSSNITAARGSFYGTYTSTLGSRYGNQALEIRENGLVTNTQSDIGYAPAIGFHWAGRIAASLVFHNDGGFRFMNQAYTDFVPVFVSTLYLGGAPYGQIYCNTSYQLYINPRGSGAVYIGYDNRCIVPPTGGAAIRGNGDGIYDCGHTSYLWGTVYAKNGVKTTSDEREKDIMSLDLSELSDCFMSIKPIAFRWKYGSDKKIHLGVGAQTTERKMIEAGYDPSQFDMIQHDELEERSVSGLMERYGINYQDLNMLTMMQTQKNAREIQLINVDLSLFKDEQDELKEEVQNLKRELALANQKIAELSAKTA